jgi:hypothetical protein
VPRKELYRLHPGGLAEICKEAGVPVPRARKAKTKSATAARVRRLEAKRADRATINNLEGHYEHEISEFRAEHQRDLANAKLSKRGLYEYAVKYLSGLDQSLVQAVKASAENFEETIKAEIDKDPSYLDATKEAEISDRKMPTVASYLNIILGSILGGSESKSGQEGDRRDQEPGRGGEVSETNSHEAEALRRLLDLTTLPERRKKSALAGIREKC